MANDFTCQDCGTTFTVKPGVLARYPGWVPRQCWPCKSGKKPQPRAAAGAAKPPARPAKKAPEQNLRAAEVLERYTKGPHDGVFTDGACSGNPGPGGWGMVWVENGEIVAEKHGHDRQTTNNRMELAALIAAYETLPRDAEVTIFSDSNLCVQTINEWAAGWKRRGWKRKQGPVKNLELVRRAYELAQTHPKARLRWIKAHNGSRWNEYADALATAYLRDQV